MMNIQLIHGQFEANDAMELITQLIHTKISFHENKITGTSNEEDIKMREKRIKELQKDLQEIRAVVAQATSGIAIQGVLEITPCT